MSPQISGRAIALAAAGVFLLQPIWSQTSGGGKGSGTSTGSTPTGGTTLPTTVSTTPSQPTTNTPISPPQPLFITGRVLLEDGSPPSDSATIERVCNGLTHAEGYSDSRGYFSLNLGDPQGAMQDASESSSPGMRGVAGTGGGSGQSSSSRGMGGTRFGNCDLQARLPGYRSQSVSLVNHRELDNPDIGIILVHRIAPSEGTTVSAAALRAPKEARKALEKGLESAKKGKLDDAMRSFQKAVEVYPGYPEAWCELGRLEMYQGDRYTARGSFQTAIRSDPKYVIPYLELSILFLKDKKWPELADMSGRAMKLDPFDYPQLFLFHAVAHYNLEHLDISETSVREAQRLDPQRIYPTEYRLLGLILLRHHEYVEAGEQLRTYLKLAPGADEAEGVRQQVAAIDRISAKNTAPKLDPPQ